MEAIKKDDWEKAMNAELEIECRGKINMEALLQALGFYYYQN
jgi:hypothetical protein